MSKTEIAVFLLSGDCLKFVSRLLPKIYTEQYRPTADQISLTFVWFSISVMVSGVDILFFGDRGTCLFSFNLTSDFPAQLNLDGRSCTISA